MYLVYIFIYTITVEKRTRFYVLNKSRTRNPAGAFRIRGERASSFAFTFILLLVGHLASIAQDSIIARLILIGDAGAVNAAQQSIIAHAAGESIPGKTLALFLGDNIYPKGFDSNDDASQDILRSQFQPFRVKNIPVCFVPGNHDWDESGRVGLERMLAVNKFISGQGDSLLKLIPGNACPGPYEFPVNDKLLIVAMDSEWWLYPYDKQTEKTNCLCKTKKEILDRLDEIIQRNHDRTIIFATHHPFYSYGSHGSYFNLRQHIFPFTDAVKWLYLPLPIVGSFYPLSRKLFPPAEDLKNPLYQQMKNDIEQRLATHPNLIHVSGHEHTLQLIQREILQVVSGAGCKHTPVKMGNGSIYACDSNGYVIADLMPGNSLRLAFYTLTPNGINLAFTYTRPHSATGINSAASHKDMQPRTRFASATDQNEEIVEVPGTATPKAVSIHRR